MSGKVAKLIKTTRGYTLTHTYTVRVKIRPLSPLSDSIQASGKLSRFKTFVFRDSQFCTVAGALGIPCIDGGGPGPGPPGGGGAGLCLVPVSKPESLL